MRGVVLAALVAFSCLFASAVAAGAPAAPTLRVVDRAPLVIRGSGFVPAERVTVVVAAGVRRTVRTTVSENGAFVARFHVTLGRCSRYSVQAFGSKGSRARVWPVRLAPGCFAND